MLAAEAEGGLRLTSEHRRILAKNLSRDRLDQKTDEPTGKARAKENRRVKARAKIFDGRAQRRDEKMILRAEPILDLRDRGQDETVEMCDNAAGRGENLSCDASRPRLADIFRLDAIGASPHADSNAARSSRAAKQTLM